MITKSRTSAWVLGFGLFAVVALGLTAGLSRIALSVNASIDGRTLELLITCMFFGALILALIRQKRIDKLTRRLVSAQAKQISYHEQALNLHALVVFCDEDCRIIEVNDKFLDAFGYTRDQVLARTQEFLFPKPKMRDQYDMVQKFVAQGQVWSGEQLVQTKAGGTRIMKCTEVPICHKDGRISGYVSIRNDITEIRRATSYRFLTGLLGKLRDGVYIFKVSDYSILYMNGVAQKTANWTKNECKKKSFLDAMENLEERAFSAAIAPLLEGKSKSVVLEAVQQSGPVEIGLHLHPGPNGQAVFVSVVRDISLRKKAEKAKASIVSIVSHELRTPITSIIGSLRLLKSGRFDAASADVASVVDVAERNSQRLLNIVNDILDYEKLRADQVEISEVQVNLVELVLEAIEANKGYGAEHEVTFEPEIEVPAAYARGDSDRLLQVMANLMSNAAKFSPRGSSVLVGISDAGDAWRISVADKGPGIPSSARRIIWGRFSRAIPADGKNRKGTGLGLAITKTIISKHGGRVDFISEIGQGTTFFFDLPKESASGASLLAEVAAE